MTCWKRATTKSSATWPSRARRTPRNWPKQVPTFILQENLYGVDLSPEAVEITQLALWIRSASRGQLLAKLSENIVHGNSLVHDAEVHPAGFDWRERFPGVFEREEAGIRLRDRQPALGANEIAGTGVLLASRPGDRHRHQCGQAAAACRQAGIGRSGLVRALSSRRWPRPIRC